MLLFTRGAQTERIWFYDMAHDGFSLDDKRTPVRGERHPGRAGVLEEPRTTRSSRRSREQRLVELQAQVAPLKAERLKLQAEINRLTFESVIAPEDHRGPRRPAPDSPNLGSAAEKAACRRPGAGCTAICNPLRNREIDRLRRQFWVTKAQVKANKYDLSASRYRQVDADEAYHEKPSVTLERLVALEKVMTGELQELGELLK